MENKENSLAKRVVDAMYGNDAFSQWLGIERLEDGPGRSVLRMAVRPEMCNGFGIAHGGITFSLADSAFAFASNSQGRKAVSIETSISHTAAVRPGDVLTATAVEEHLSNKIANYRVTVTNQDGQVVALFKGTVYRMGTEWEV
jgi:acyl-CoA thioesterase